MKCQNYFSGVLWYVVLPILVSEVIAIAWIEGLDPEWDGLEKKIDLSALDQLNLIIGFLYVGLIRDSRSKWQSLVKLVNEFVITAGTLIQYDRTFKTDVQDLDAHLQEYLLNKKKSNDEIKAHIEKLKSLTRKVYTIVSKAKEKDSITQSLSLQLKTIVESLDRQYFEGEPALFKWHLRFLLGLYFASIPAQLYNSYGVTGTLVLYPCIIYFLFAVVLWSNALHSPLEHPEIVPRFQKLRQSFDNFIEFTPYTDGAIRTMKLV